LGATGVKAAHKYVGEIDPRYQFFLPVCIKRLGYLINEKYFFVSKNGLNGLNQGDTGRKKKKWPSFLDHFCNKIYFHSS